MASNAPITLSTNPPLSSSNTPKCLCSPSTHPGSFRCSRHRSRQPPPKALSPPATTVTTATTAISAMDRVESSKARNLKAFLKQIINPSSRAGDRRWNFRPAPSRLGSSFILNDNFKTLLSATGRGWHRSTHSDWTQSQWWRTEEAWLYDEDDIVA